MTLYLSVFCGLLSMVSYGISSAYAKPLSNKFGSGRLIFLRGIAVSVILAVAAILSGSRPDNFPAIFATFLLGVAGYIPVLAFTHAVKNSRIGIVAPIAGTAPLVTVLLAYLFLNVFINPVQWLAIACVVFANAAISFDLKNWRNSSILQMSSGIPLALVAALGWGLFYFFLVPSTHALGPWLSACIAEIGVTVAAGLHVGFKAKKLLLADALQPSIVVNAVLLCIGTVAFTVGIRYDVGIVATLSNSTAIISAFIGALAFKERLHTKEKILAAVMIAGIAIISFG